MKKTFSAPAAVLLLASAAGVLVSSCTPPMPPPPPAARGRNLDVPPRYGAEQQTRYFDGANMADPSAVQNPDPNAAVTSPDMLTTPPASTGTTPTTPPPPVVVTPPSTSTPPTVNTPPASTPPPAAADIPYASRIPGKPGFVKSPFDPSGQAIDVRDFTSGQKAKCPYTGKVFRVP